VPIIRLKEIRDMPSEERINKLNELRTELLRLKTMIRAGGTIENPARVKAVRKTIARILTIENEQRLGIAKAEPAKKPERKRKK
jgi:large subunit ribosomal protein L29